MCFNRYNEVTFQEVTCRAPLLSHVAFFAPDFPGPGRSPHLATQVHPEVRYILLSFPGGPVPGRVGAPTQSPYSREAIPAPLPTRLHVLHHLLPAAQRGQVWSGEEASGTEAEKGQGKVERGGK